MSLRPLLLPLIFLAASALAKVTPPATPPPSETPETKTSGAKNKQEVLSPETAKAQTPNQDIRRLEKTEIVKRARKKFKPKPRPRAPAQPPQDTPRAATSQPAADGK